MIKLMSARFCGIHSRARATNVTRPPNAALHELNLRRARILCDVARAHDGVYYVTGDNVIYSRAVETFNETDIQERKTGEEYSLTSVKAKNLYYWQTPESDMNRVGSTR